MRQSLTKDYFEGSIKKCFDQLNYSKIDYVRSITPNTYDPPFYYWFALH